MRLKLYYLFIAFIGLAAITGCDDDDAPDVFPSDTPSWLPTQIAGDFQSRCPHATAQNTRWTNDSIGGWYRAEYEWNRTETDVWYKASDNTWAMTEEDYGKNLFMISAPVNTAFNQSVYATWEIDDITYLTYPDSSRDVYCIEVEKAGEQPMDVYFKESGHTASLYKAVAHSEADPTPDTQI